MTIDPSPTSTTAVLAPQPPRIRTARELIAIIGFALGTIALASAFLPWAAILTMALAVACCVLGVVALALRKGSRIFALVGIGLGPVAIAIVIVSALLQTQLAGLGVDPERASPDNTAVLEFGDTASFGNGLTATVSEPEQFVTTDPRATEAHAVLVTITLYNDSDEVFDPTTLVSLSSGGVEASELYVADLTSRPLTTVLPGGSVTWSEAFAVGDPDDLVLEFSPGLRANRAVFASSTGRDPA